jgi:competence protein ComEC
MAGEDIRAAARARARALAAELDAARRRAGLLWPAAAVANAERLGEALKHLIAIEVAPGRLLPWLAVGFGLGAVIYFDADREPALWAVSVAAAAGVAIAVAARKTALGLAVALAFASTACGFAAITWKTASIAHPILHFPATVDLKGFIEVREEREKTDRIVIRVQHIEGRRLNEAPDRVRLAVRKGTAPAVGDFIALRARLSPPLEQLRPGGYDFARDMYFQRIGASGYALGRLKIEPPPVPVGYWLRYLALVDSMREAIDDRIRAALPGDQGSIASALITGKRDAISAPVNDAMYVSSLAHVLSISGYHMVVVAGIVFFVLRASLALVPALATRRPIKKWAAVAALIAATFYLLLSGAEVATQRSYIMIAIVLIGVLFDRTALTLRTLSIAAFAVLMLAPQAVIHPSFQMSFAATLALVAAYQNGLAWRADRDSSLTARAALWGAREIVGLILASLVAGLATTPFVAFHFHRLAPYGVLANLLAMPVVSAWVMPMGILGVMTMPFGFDALFWHAMGWGIDWMIAVAQWVASLPGAVGRIAAFGSGPLLLASAGLLLICLLRTKIRWSGAVLAGLAALWIAATDQPEVYVAGDGRATAFRGDNGRLSVLQRGRDTFALREWLAADADARPLDDKTMSKDVRCDDFGCVGRLRDGRLIAMPLALEAFDEDCARAALVVSPRQAPGDCQAALIDRNSLREHGAAAVRFNGEQVEIQQARSRGYQRPWAQAPRRSPQAVPQTQDATPPLNNLEADD